MSGDTSTGSPREIGRDEGAEVLIGVGDVVDDHPHRAPVTGPEGTRHPLVLGAAADEVDQSGTSSLDRTGQRRGLGHDNAGPSCTTETLPA